MEKPSTRFSRSWSPASPCRRPPLSWTARAYSGPNLVRNLSVRRLRIKSQMAMPATSATATAMTMTICVVLIADRFITCLQFLVDSLGLNLRVAAVRLCEAVPASLFFDGFLHLSDFLLDLPGDVLNDAFGF